MSTRVLHCGLAAAVGTLAAGAETGEVGMTTHATTYAISPQMTAPGRMESNTNSTRTAVGSIPTYSAIPPHTPAIFESLADRRSLFERHELSDATTSGSLLGAVSGIMSHATT